MNASMFDFLFQKLIISSPMISKKDSKISFIATAPFSVRVLNPDGINIFLRTVKARCNEPDLKNINVKLT